MASPSHRLKLSVGALGKRLRIAMRINKEESSACPRSEFKKNLRNSTGFHHLLVL